MRYKLTSHGMIFLANHPKVVGESYPPPADIIRWKINMWEMTPYLTISEGVQDHDCQKRPKSKHAIPQNPIKGK